MVKAFELQESFVYAVNLNIGGIALQDFHHPATHVAIEGVVRRKDLDFFPRKNVFVLKGRGSHGNPKGFCFVAARNYATVVIRQNHDGLSLPLRLKNPFTRSVKIVTIDQCKHPSKNTDLSLDLQYKYHIFRKNWVEKNKGAKGGTNIKCCNFVY